LLELTHKPINSIQIFGDSSELSKTQPINLPSKSSTKKTASITKYEKNKKDQDEKKIKVISLDDSDVIKIIEES